MSTREQIEELHQKYLFLKKNTPREKRDGEECEAYHEWYNSAYVYFKSFVALQDDPEMEEFVGAEKDGNCFVLERIYDEISPSYQDLMRKTSDDYKPQIGEPSTQTQKIFISHSSKDKLFVDHFIDIILKQALGLRDENIVYTSFEATGVPPGDSIPEYIKNNIAAASVILAMVSHNYKASEVCQNEVGAAWALGKRPIQVMLPDTDFKELGWLLNLEKATKIDEGNSLDYLAEVLCREMNITMPTPLHWNKPRKQFLDAVNRTSQEIENQSPSCRICFEDGTQEITIRPKFKVISYRPVSPAQDIAQNATEDDAISVLCGSTKKAMDALLRSAQATQVKPLMSSSFTKETDYAKCELNLRFINNDDALENVQVTIKAPNDTVFSKSNYKKLGFAVYDIAHHSNTLSIEDETYRLRLGNVNADTIYEMPHLYVIPPYAKCLLDTSTTLEDCYPKQIQLPYLISTKHKKHEGTLYLNVAPEFYDANEVSNEKAGKKEITPYTKKE